MWATLLAVAVGALLLPYPFLPRHLTIIDTLAIGVPSFFLALAPNPRRYRPGFTGRVLRFAIPAGLIVAAATFAAYCLARVSGLSLVQQRTAATLVTLTLSLCVLTLLGDAADLAADRPAGRGGSRLPAAVPPACRPEFLRAGTPAR